MAAKKGTSPEIKREIIERGRQGEPYRALAYEYGLSYQSIANYVAESRGRKHRTATRPVDGAILDGYVRRQQILDQMNEMLCGGCGQHKPCKQVKQNDSHFPAIMWLCYACRSRDCWQKSIVA